MAGLDSCKPPAASSPPEPSLIITHGHHLLLLQIKRSASPAFLRYRESTKPLGFAIRLLGTGARDDACSRHTDANDGAIVEIQICTPGPRALMASLPLLNGSFRYLLGLLCE